MSKVLVKRNKAVERPVYSEEGFPYINKVNTLRYGVHHGILWCCKPPDGHVIMSLSKPEDLENKGDRFGLFEPVKKKGRVKKKKTKR